MISCRDGTSPASGQEAASDIDRFSREIEILDAGANGVCDPTDSVILSRTDSNPDAKKMVAIEAQELGSGGYGDTCARMTLTKIAPLYYSPIALNAMCRPIAIMDDDYAP